MARYDWETIRAEYEAGSTMGELSRKHGVNKAAISRRAKKEGWTQDLSGVVDRLAEAKVNGIVNTVDLKKKAEAVDAAAVRKADVILRHRDAWPKIKALNAQAIEAQDFNAAKLAKITAETERIIQDGERKAWGITDKSEDTPSPSQTVSVQHDVSPEIAGLINLLKVNSHDAF